MFGKSRPVGAKFFKHSVLEKSLSVFEILEIPKKFKRNIIKRCFSLICQNLLFNIDLDSATFRLDIKHGGRK